MECDRYSEKLADYVRGALPDGEIAEVDAHIGSCERCRGEMDDLRWFLEGVKTNQAAIRDGHVSSRLLYEFVDNSPPLDRDTIDRVEKHLGECEACRRDRERIEELIALEHPSGSVVAAPAGHGTGRFSWTGFRPVFSGLAAVLAIVAFVWVFLTLTDKPDYRVSLVSSAAGFHTVDVQLSDLVRGDPQSTPVVRLGESEQRQTVLRIEVDVFEGEAVPAEVVIRGANLETVWSGMLETSQAGSGTVLLLIDETTFAAGRYTIEILDTAGVSMGRAVVEFQ